MSDIVRRRFCVLSALVLAAASCSHGRLHWAYALPVGSVAEKADDLSDLVTAEISGPVVVGDDPAPAPIPSAITIEPNLGAVDGKLLLPPGRIYTVSFPLKTPASGVTALQWSCPDGWDYVDGPPGNVTTFRFTADRSAGVLALKWNQWDGVAPSGDSLSIAYQIGDPGPPEPEIPLSVLAGEHRTGLTTACNLLATVITSGASPRGDLVLANWNDYAVVISGVPADNKALVAITGVLAKAIGQQPEAVAIDAAKGEQLVALLAEVVLKLDAPAPTPPGPQPTPVPVAGLRVLIVEETLDRGKLPQSQLGVLSGTAVRKYVADHGGQFRQLDDDDDVHLLAEEWQKLRASVTTPAPSWAIYTPQAGVSAPLPLTDEAALTELKRLAP